jgi:CheY-like chemotaxis protein
MAEAWEVEPGNFVVLSVTDTGVGMDPAVRARAFDPFFTTKEVGKGSGLGLSMVYGFVKQLGGFVKIYSEPGQGTSVRLFLPGAPLPDQGTGAGDGDVGLVPMGNGERILVVEDEPKLLELSLLLCESLGYRPVPATDGSEALEVLRARDPLDLLLTDVVLPGERNGVELAAEARKIRPGLKVLLTSGYAEPSILRNAQLDPELTLLTKPFDRGTLARKLHAVLNR